MTSTTKNIFTGSYPLFKTETISSTRFGNMSFFILCYSVCFCIAWSYISKNPKAYSILSKFFEFIRSMTAGLIFSMFFLEQYKKILNWNKIAGATSLFLSNLPVIVMTTIYLLVTLGIFLFRREKVTENKYQRILENVENASLNDQESRGIDFLGKGAKKFAVSEIEDFNSNDAPYIYLPLLMFHSFFAGLGYSGCQYLGWAELLIVVHKLCEICRLKNALDKTRASYRESLSLMIMFIIMTPCGVLLRGYFSLYNVKFGEILASKLCENIFAQSFLVIACISTLIPFPITWLDVGINWLTAFASYFMFHSYFENGTSSIELN